jgi:hypothetical protein
MGRVLQACPHPNALPQTRRLDCAAYLVASLPALAMWRLAAVAIREVVRRVWLGQLDFADSFVGISPWPEGVFVKAVCRKSARTLWAAGGGQRASAPPPTRQRLRAELSCWSRSEAGADVRLGLLTRPCQLSRPATSWFCSVFDNHFKDFDLAAGALSRAVALCFEPPAYFLKEVQNQHRRLLTGPLPFE